MAGQKIEIGATSKTVAANLTRLRKSLNLNYTEVSKRLEAIGHNGISALAVRRMEETKRRVDVDDLMALSLALGVNPNALLVRSTESATEKVELSGRDEPIMAQTLWGWLQAKNCLGAIDDQVLFRRRALPRWLVEQDEERKRIADLRNLQNRTLLDELASRKVADNGND